MNIPDSLVRSIEAGRVVLLLGAGATLDAEDAANRAAPDGEQLKNLLANNFLGGKFKDRSLSYVAELAISERDLAAVQDFVADQFRELRPTRFHKLLPTFRWRGIATTNYDRIIEDSYREPKAIQELVPFLSDADRVDEKLRSPNHVAYLKLHGCISHTHDSSTPLLLTHDNMVEHKKNRVRLYDLLRGWAFECPVVIIGHRGEDLDVRAVFEEVSADLQLRPRYFLIQPDASDEEVRLWANKKVAVLDGTFENFLDTLDSTIPKEHRQLSALLRADHPIRKWMIESGDIEPRLQTFLSSDVELVYEGMPVEVGTPNRFYRGFDLGWYPIENELDVRRHLTDAILSTVVLRSESERPTIADLYAIKAEAGAGKSVLLRRLAWEASIDAGVLALYVREGRRVDVEDLRDLLRVTNERVFLFWDNAADNVPSIRELLDVAIGDQLRITIVTAERLNSWNMSCEGLDEYLADSFVPKYLSHNEIESLVHLLEKHHSLGKQLTSLSVEDRVKEFEERAGRQLLVALHEATLGRPFEEIIVDEYGEISPDQARALYLTVCVLNRLNVAVRAGLISRVHQIRFEDFDQRFFRPLEHVVKLERDKATQDYSYRARHPEIAQIVFERVLTNAKDRYHEISRVLSELNVAYSSDRRAFRELIRARALHEMFPNYEDVKSLFRIAQESEAEKAYVLHQMANYERLRPNGNIGQARQYLAQARRAEPNNPTIIHTLAEVARTEAERAEKRLERQRLRTEAQSLLAPLLQIPREALYAHHTMVKLSVDEVKDLMGVDDATDREIDDAIRGAERRLQAALQQFPNEEILRSTEAAFRTLLGQSERAFAALRRAFDANPRDPHIASRLARMWESKGETEEAIATIHKALENNRGDQSLNFRYAMLLKQSDPTNSDAIKYHLKRAFTPGDKSFEAQFWWARYAFESDKPEERQESAAIFRRLRAQPIGYRKRTSIRDRVKFGEKPGVFEGVVVKHDDTFGYIQRDRFGDQIFYHESEQTQDIWRELRRGVRVSFEIGFSLSGPQALSIRSATDLNQELPL